MLDFEDRIIRRLEEDPRSWLARASVRERPQKLISQMGRGWWDDMHRYEHYIEHVIELSGGAEIHRFIWIHGEAISSN